METSRSDVVECDIVSRIEVDTTASIAGTTVEGIVRESKVVCLICLAGVGSRIGSVHRDTTHSESGSYYGWIIEIDPVSRTKIKRYCPSPRESKVVDRNIHIATIGAVLHVDRSASHDRVHAALNSTDRS